jgi:uncharacterized membrane protein SpoIIM required for sporulation
VNQQSFELSSESDWQRYDELVGHHGKKKKDGCPEDLYELPLLYQKLCTQYSIALARSYSPALISDLHERVYRGHTLLYRKKGQLRWRFIEFFLSRFPWQLRQHARYFALATCIFYLPAILMGMACFLNSDMLYSVMPASSVSNMETMYNPERETIGRTKERESDTDLMMFGHYILNNISIGFRSFAMGILFGIGTVFTLGYNGIVIGGVSGHLTGIGYTETFWPFVSGHSAFELTAIVICGAAGLRLAQPIFAPGRFTRVHGLKIAGRESVELVMGAAVMLVAAAFIEAFWSSSTSVQPLLKYAVGVFFWILLTLYFLSAGKSYHAG